MFRKKKQERGAITVEATIALTAFLFMFMMLYSIVTICRAQATIGSALNNTAKEISQYTYLYSLTGIHDSLGQATSTDITGDVDKLAEGINASFNSMQSMNDDVQSLSQTEITDMSGVLQDWNTLSYDLRNDLTETKENVTGVADSIKELAKDPKHLLIGLCKIAADDGISLVKSKLITPPICKVLIQKHLKSYDEQSTESYLKGLNIVPGSSNGEKSYIDGLDFSNSSLFCSEDYDIVLRVEYEVEVTPYLPIDIKINMCQSAATRGWADGDGRHVKDNGEVVVVKPEVETETGNNLETTTNKEETSSESSQEETTSGDEDNKTPRDIMVDKYGEGAIKDIEDAYSNTDSWTIDDWEYYVVLYTNSEPTTQETTTQETTTQETTNIDTSKENEYEKKYSRENVLANSSGVSVDDALKNTIDKFIKEYPDKKDELMKYYSKDEFVKLINRGCPEYNSKDYSNVSLSDRYSEIEMELLETVHNQLKPDAGTIMQKVILDQKFEGYTGNDIVARGCVSRVQDVLAYTGTYEETRRNLRLDYSGTRFPNTVNKTYYVVRYQSKGNTYSTPQGDYPCTSNGFLGCGIGALAEWNSAGDNINSGAVFIVYPDGTEEFTGYIESGKYVQSSKYGAQ